MSGQTIDHTIAQLRSIASQSALALVTEGPVQPDHQLLDLCAEALGLLTRAEKLRRDHRVMLQEAVRMGRNDATWARLQTLLSGASGFEKTARPPLCRIARTRATTAAGIYAKALVVRASRTGAAALARSLAEDMVECGELRATIWAVKS